MMYINNNKLLLTFLQNDLNKQREILSSNNDNKILEILIHIVCKQEANKDVLVQFLPYIDGIIIDNPSLIENIIEISNKSGFNLMKCLLRVVSASEVIYDSFVFDMCVRILSKIFSK